MTRIAICEDERPAGELLHRQLLDWNKEIAVEEFDSPEGLLAAGAFDLYFLDIGFCAGTNGMELAHSLRRRWGREAVIIFVTGYEQYVFDAFDVGAFHYLVKPVDEGKFAGVFARAAEQVMTGWKVPQRARPLVLSFAGTNKVVPLDSIYYIESSNHKAILHMKDGEFACYMKSRDLGLELQEDFFRIHKGYLVNLSYVSGYSKTEVTLTNGEKLLLSKYKYPDFAKAYLRFLKKGAGL